MCNVSRLEEYKVTNDCMEHFTYNYSLVDCGPPPEIANGSARAFDTIHYGFGLRTVAASFCNRGARLVGNSTIDCRDDGTWEDPPMCVPLSEYMN